LTRLAIEGQRLLVVRAGFLMVGTGARDIAKAEDAVSLADEVADFLVEG
jgi:hypothetical protein